MSEQVYKTGKIKLIESDYEKIWQHCKNILEEEYNMKFNNTYQPEDYIDIFIGEIYQDYVLLDSGLYKVIELNNLDDYNIYEIHDNKDGTMEFVLGYYNGGESFNEAMEEAYRQYELNNK